MDKTIEQMIAVAPGGEAVSREGALHKAVCEAVIHLNIGENFQASHILRAALVEYADHQAQQPAAAVPEGYAAAIKAVQEMMPPRDFRPSAQVWLTGNQVNELHARLDAAAILAAERKGVQS